MSNTNFETFLSEIPVKDIEYSQRVKAENQENTEGFFLILSIICVYCIIFFVSSRSKKGEE